MKKLLWHCPLKGDRDRFKKFGQKFTELMKGLPGVQLQN
jgi:hypothetical protein